MSKDQRKSRRQHVRYTAWLVLEGEKLHGCVLQDASDTGARIDVEDSETIPDDFMLLLNGNGSARRKCHVVWRKPRQVGVKFVARPAMSKQATLVPSLEADDAVRLDPVKTA